MFPYSSNLYPSFLPTSSSYSSCSLLPFPFLNPENASSTHHHNTLLHDPLISLPYHNIQIPETLNSLALAADNNNCALIMPKNDPSSGGAPNYGISSLLTKKPAKKDRHSKIYTSQGLRDRRVRLSIEIARKFFDLQDMLGFDKASNTLDWLFTKSKKAIKELAKSKNNNNNSEGDVDGAKSFTSDSECEDCEVVSDTPNLQQQQQEFLDVGDVKERKLKRTLKESREKANKMKESREKARARARERTSNKICINTNNNNKIFHQSRPELQHDIQDCERSPNNKMVQVQPHHPHHHHHHLVGNEAQRDNFNVIEESIVIKRKLKPSMMVSHHHHHHHHQNLVAPKEASYNNSDYHSFPNSSPNWDANNGAPNGRSSFCAIASMNLSTGLQIFGKSWEECTNPRLH